MPSCATPLLTIGQIAVRVGEPIHRVEYVIRSRKIAPRAIAGNARVFGEPELQRIQSELNRIKRERANRK